MAVAPPPSRKPARARLALWLGVATLATSFADAAPRRPRADRVTVPAGPFVRGSTVALDERPQEKKRLPAFKIDRTEVTRAQYGACVEARRCPPLAGVDLAVDGDLPVTNVSWKEARSYCAFVGGKLPTEDQWEKAARGEDGREFPWGSEADCARGNWGVFEGEGPCAGKNPGRPVAVGQYAAGASPYGALDLGGNVWEWVENVYDEDRARRVVRGGSCCSYFVPPRAANRNAWAPDHRDGDLGFRCVSR
jgi:formylglycine-generating enzyme required for sulfatase activity